MATYPTESAGSAERAANERRGARFLGVGMWRAGSSEVQTVGRHDRERCDHLRKKERWSTVGGKIISKKK